MDWESNWILSNIEMYHCIEHAEAVILNIEKRKKIIDLEKLVEQYTVELTKLGETQ